MSFQGFCAEGIDLLQMNRLQNNKDFYDAHKEELKQKAVQPFYDLIEEITPAMLTIDPQFMLVPRRMVCRIRRDTRFTKDKTMYRANLWVMFSRAKQRFQQPPGFYFEVHPDFWSYGCFGGDTTKEMAEIREMILREEKPFLEAKRAVEKTKGMQLNGEFYKRPKHPEAKPEYQDWLNRKYFVVQFEEHEDFQSLLDGSFVDGMVKNFQTLKPFYDFVWMAHDRAKPQEKEIKA